MSSVTCLEMKAHRTAMQEELRLRSKVRPLDGEAIYIAVDPNDENYMILGTLQQIQMDIESYGYSVVRVSGGTKEITVFAVEMYPDNDDEEVFEWKLIKPVVSNF